MKPESLRPLLAVALLVGLMASPLGLWSQERELRKANSYFQVEDYARAEELYKEVLSQDPNSYIAARRLGQINTNLRDYQEALQFYRRATEIAPSRSDTLYFWMGVTYKILGNCRSAREALNEFQRRHKTRDDYYQRAEREMRGCDLIESYENDKPAYRVRGVSFNSPFFDYFPALLDQRQNERYVVFASHRPLSERRRNRIDDQLLGQPNPADLYQVLMEDDSTFGTEVVNIGKPINSKKEDEGAATFTGDGLTMYLAITQTKGRNYGTSIYVSRYDPFKKRWNKPELLEGVNGTIERVVNDRGKTRQVPSYDTHPYITPDGRTLFFVSNRDGGQGGLDVWFSRRVGAGWSEPINAGPTINTPFDDIKPFWNAEASKLYFASNGHTGFGGYDIFVADGDLGNWQQPVNMGAPINSTYDDLGAIFWDNDSSLLLSTNRPGGNGGYDVYFGRMIRYIEPPVEITLQGKIRNKKTKQPVPFATAILFEKTDQGLVSLDTFNTGQDARYQFPLEPATSYKVLGNAPEYFANEIEVTTPDGAAELERNIDIELEPIYQDEIFVLQNIYYDFDEYYLREDAVLELDTLVSIMKENTNISVQLNSHTDTNGSNAYNLTLSLNRARSAVRYLLDMGINPTRITYQNFGEERPLIFPELTPMDEQINRRTEFQVTSIGLGLPPNQN